MKKELELVVIDALKEVIGDGSPVTPAEVQIETPLFGRHGVLDSVGLVSLVVAVEQAIEDKYGVALSLADEKALSQARSPFRTVGSLAEYAAALIPVN